MAVIEKKTTEKITNCTKLIVFKTCKTINSVEISSIFRNSTEYFL